MASFKILPLLALVLPPLVSSQLIDPNSVNITVRETWCTNQQASCPLICLQLPGASGSPEANNCTATDLSYSCICSNGVQPNASQYSQTIPYFECTTYNTQCQNACPQADTVCYQNCLTSHPCGAQDPVRVNLSTVTTSTMASTTGAASTATGSDTAQFTTGLGGSPQASASGSSTSDAVRPLASSFGQIYGLTIVFFGFIAGFVLVL
ncbi:hypothetical protein MMC13_006232 [Lambiella insularis]|nr:hypothetical protein [Lambiella insularis]